MAYAVYVSDRQKLSLPTPQAPAPPPVREPASTVPEAIEETPESGVTFDFYDMLPNLDVEIYEDQRQPARVAPKQAPPPPKVEKPGIYILQAGSFSRLTDANRRKAQIALLGVHAEIKKGNANGRAVYRVYTDPMEQPAEVNRVSKLLTDSGIEILRKRVSD